MRKYVLCIRHDSDPEEKEECIQLLEQVKVKHSVDYGIIDTSLLAEDARHDLISNIRQVSAAQGVAVKSQGKGPLPISRNASSLGKICTLLLYDDNKLIGVYPHSRNMKRNDVVPYLQKVIASDDMNAILEQQAITEDDISRMITTFPELIEPGLKFLDTEVTVDGGRIDAVFVDNEGKHLLIEIEIEVKDNAIGQLQRFITYSDKFQIARDHVRLGFVCARIAESRLNACKGANIEVYRLGLDRVA